MVGNSVTRKRSVDRRIKKTSTLTLLPVNRLELQIRNVKFQSQNKHMDAFLPQGYEVPTSNSSYTKLEKGDTKIRFITKPITGYQYWTTENKPVRSATPFTETPNIKLNDKGEKKIEHFWVMGVYNYNTKKQEVFVMTQKSIMNAIVAFAQNPAWGTPTEYDVVINRKGDMLTTEYNVMPNPKAELSAEVKELIKPLNLDILYTGGNPFEVVAETLESVTVEIEQAF